MEVINGLGLKPVCALLPHQRAKPRKIFQVHTQPSHKITNPSALEAKASNLRENLARNFHVGLVLFASALSGKLASALTYEEALEQSVTTNSAVDFDVGSVIDSILDNPVLLFGGVAVIAVPLIVSQILGDKPKAFGVVSAKTAYAKLADDPHAQLLDIRSSKELREVGSPDIRGLKKKPVSIVYKGEDKPGFLEKLSLKFKDPENTSLYILDKFDGNSELVAELVTANGFKSAYAIKDGAEGPRGWLNSGLPWMLPKKTFGLDLSGLTEAFGYGGAGALPVTLGLAAVTGVGLLAFTEVEPLLQLFGSLALVQFFTKKLLFAEDRKQTLQQLDEFINTQIAPKELVSDIKQIAIALLPTPASKPALPAPTEAASDYAVTDNGALTAEAASHTGAETAAQATPTINSTPQSEVKAGSPPRALSPYPAYPDFKPPTSPCPSPP